MGLVRLHIKGFKAINNDAFELGKAQSSLLGFAHILAL